MRFLDVIRGLADFIEGMSEIYRAHSRVARSFRWNIHSNSFTVSFHPVQGGISMLLLTDTQKVTLSIQPLDAKGFPAKVDGVPAWSVSDEAVGNIVPASDGMSAVFTAGAPGTCQINVQADADLGQGVAPISGTLDIQVEPGQAVSLGISAATPEAQ